jgi:hypothetical protein
LKTCPTPSSQRSDCRLQVEVALEDGWSFHIDQAATALGTG